MLAIQVSSKVDEPGEQWLFVQCEISGVNEVITTITVCKGLGLNKHTLARWVFTCSNIFKRKTEININSIEPAWLPCERRCIVSKLPTFNRLL